METRTARARHRRRASMSMPDPFDVPTRPFNSRVLALANEAEHLVEETLDRPWATHPLDLPGEQTAVSGPPEMPVLEQPPGRDTIPTAFPGVWLPDAIPIHECEEQDYDDECTTTSFRRQSPCPNDDNVVSMTFPSGWPWVVILVSLVTTAVSLGGLLWA